MESKRAVRPDPSKSKNLTLFFSTGALMLFFLFWASLGPSAHRMESLIVMSVLLLSAMASSVAGFAFSAIAGAVLYHLMDSPGEAVRLMITCSLAIQMYSVLHLRKQIQWSRLVPFLIGGIITVVPCCWFLCRMRPGPWLLMVGGLLVVLGAYMLLRKPVTVVVQPKTRRSLDMLAGAMGGVLAPVAALPGPPVTIWCNLQGLDKVQQRAIFQPFILLMQAITLLMLTFMDSQRSQHFGNILWAIPAIVGCHFGLMVFRRITDRWFHAVIYFLLVISGLSLLIKCI